MTTGILEVYFFVAITETNFLLSSAENRTVVDSNAGEITVVVGFSVVVVGLAVEVVVVAGTVVVRKNVKGGFARM